jgi:glutamine synthetase
MNTPDTKSNLKNIIVEYIFIDGFNNVRSKTRIINPSEKRKDTNDSTADTNTADTTVTTVTTDTKSESKNMFYIDNWSVDGSSTGQSETNNSDIILVPRSIFADPFNKSNDNYQYLLCMCEIFNNDGTPHKTNTRSHLFATMKSIGEELLNKDEPLFGIEQEYIIMEKDGIKPYKWDDIIRANSMNPKTKSQFYCSVGSDRSFGREIAMEHMNMCLNAGIAICGINSEVVPSQWEYQIGVCSPFIVGDHLWASRYILSRVAELHDVCISYDPKPVGEYRNGSGGHTNFSTKAMREPGGLDIINKAISKLEGKHMEHIAVYGECNDKRLTGSNETSNINTFTYGDCDRGSSIRIPINVKIAGCGYFEDRRPAANLDPYLVCSKLMETILL